MMMHPHTRLRAEDGGAAEGGSSTATIDAPSGPSDMDLNSAFREMAAENTRAVRPSSTTVQDSPTTLKVADTKTAPAKDAAKKSSTAIDAFEVLGMEKVAPEKTTATATEKKPQSPSIDTSKEAQEKLSGPSDRSSEGTKTNWKQLNAVADQLRTELTSERSAWQAEKAKMEAELTQLRQTVGNPDEYKRIKDEHSLMSDKLKVFAVREHPEFKAKFIEPKNQRIAETAQLLTEYGVEGVDVAALAAKGRKAFAEEVGKIAQELPDLDRHTFIDNMKKIRELHDGEAAELSKAGELAKSYQERSLNQQRGVFEKLWSEGNALRSKEVPATATAEERAELESYNEGIKSIRSEAEKFLFNPYNEESAAKMALKGATLDFMVKQGIPKLNSHIQKQAARIAELESEIDSLRAHGPGSFDGGQTQASGPRDVSDDEINSAFGALRVR